MERSGSISPNSTNQRATTPTNLDQDDISTSNPELDNDKISNNIKDDCLSHMNAKSNIDLFNGGGAGAGVSDKFTKKNDLQSFKANGSSLNYMNEMNNMNNSNYMSLPINLGNNNNNNNIENKQHQQHQQQQQQQQQQQNDYDLFVNQMALAASMNPSLLTAAVNSNTSNSQSPKLNNIGQQQQLFAQTIAALAAVSINNNGIDNNNNNNVQQKTSNSNNNNNISNNNTNGNNQNRSILENIEMLNSKFMNQKHKMDQIQQNNMPLLNQNQIHSTPISQNSLSGLINNSRLNSTPNFGYGGVSNLNNDLSKMSQKSAAKMNSISTSNSSFNLTDNHNMSNSSFDNDDEVFSTSNSLNNSSASASQFMGSATSLQEALTLAFYQKLLAANSSGMNINDFILNNNNNTSNMSSLNPTDLMSVQQNYADLQSNKTINTKNVNLPPATMALLKQRQNNNMNNNNNNNRLIGNNNSNSLSSSNQSGNIAALTSATSNIASLLGQSHQHIHKSASTSSSQIGPNAAHLLQNSSLASSARLNTNSLSSTATASVLGNNSQLSHALNPLQHHNSNHGLLSALSSNGSQLDNQLLSSTGKPLRSERLPQPVIDELVKQAKIRRRNGGKKEVCVFCRNNGEKEQIFTSHALKDASNRVACPILRLYQCPICHASGDQAHTIKYCPYTEKDSAYFKLFKENGRMAEAAAFLMNSLAGNETPPLSPPGTSSSSAFFNPNNQSFSSFSAQDFNTSGSSLNDSSKQMNDLDMSLNKSFGQHNGSLLAYNFGNQK